MQLSRFCCFLFVCCAAVLSFAGTLMAQTVTGVVVDPDGAAVPHLDLTISAQPGTTTATDRTNAEGHFHFSDIAAGDYTLTIPAAFGFHEYHQMLRVRPGLGEIHIQLIPSSVTEDVNVSAGVGEVSLDADANRDQMSTTGDALEKLPVFDQDYIAALTPFLDQTGIATSGPTIVVDGIEMKGTGVSASAIAEARINNDPYSVETNRPGRGRIEIITKPGSPQFHGP